MIAAWKEARSFQDQVYRRSTLLTLSALCILCVAALASTAFGDNKPSEARFRKQYWKSNDRVRVAAKIYEMRVASGDSIEEILRDDLLWVRRVALDQALSTPAKIRLSELLSVLIKERSPDVRSDILSVVVRRANGRFAKLHRMEVEALAMDDNPLFRRLAALLAIGDGEFLESDTYVTFVRLLLSTESEVEVERWIAVRMIAQPDIFVWPDLVIQCREDSSIIRKIRMARDYLVKRLRDQSPCVQIEAINTLQRLAMIDMGIASCARSEIRRLVVYDNAAVSRMAGSLLLEWNSVAEKKEHCAIALYCHALSYCAIVCGNEAEVEYVVNSLSGQPLRAAACWLCSLFVGMPEVKSMFSHARDDAVKAIIDGTFRRGGDGGQ